MWMSRTLPFKIFHINCRSVSRTKGISKIELFVILVYGFQSLTSVTNTSILDVVQVLVTLCSGSFEDFFWQNLLTLINPLMPGGNKKVTHTYHQALKC